MSKTSIRLLFTERLKSPDLADWSRLEAALGPVVDCPARKTVVKKGNNPAQSILLIEGVLSAYIDDRNGLRQLIAVYFPGDFIDLHACPPRLPGHGIDSLTHAKLSYLSHEDQDEILHHYPELMRRFWTLSARNLAISQAWLFRLGRLDAKGRVAHFICEANARLLSVGLSDGRRFRLSLTQSDLAEICGLTNVHINRVMRQLREEKLCIFRSSVVEILDYEKLAARGQFNPDYVDIKMSDGPMTTRQSLSGRASGMVSGQDAIAN